MRGITIRFGDSTYEMVKHEAALEGVSLSAFIREAALMRACIQRARRGEHDPDLVEPIRAHLEAERQHRLGNH